MRPLLTFWYYSHVEKEQLVVTYVRYFHRYPSLTCTARVTWQPAEASLVTCHRSSFRKLFFLLHKTDLPTSRLLLPPIGSTRQPQRSDWPDREHVCARHNQTTPPSFKSFMCNWYRPRSKKTAGISVFWGQRNESRDGSQPLRWVCESAAEHRDDSVYFSVKLQLLNLLPKISQGVHCQSCYLFIQYLNSGLPYRRFLWFLANLDGKLA